MKFMSKKLHHSYLYFLVIFLSLWPNFSYGETCNITSIKKSDVVVKNREEYQRIKDLVEPYNDDMEYSIPDILDVDINNDGKKEYIIFSWEGTGHYLHWAIYSYDGRKVPDTFWGTDNKAKENLFSESYNTETAIWITKVCGKNYLGFHGPDNSKSLYLIGSKITKACTPEWINFYKTRDITEGWSSFCETPTIERDSTKLRDDLIGYYSVNDACLSPYTEKGPSLDPGRSEIIIRPYQDKDLDVTIITGGYPSSSKGPEQTIRTGIATYDPEHGYVIKEHLNNIYYPNIRDHPQTIYIVPTKDKLVLEIITPPRIANSTWDYSQRKKIPEKCADPRH